STQTAIYRLVQGFAKMLSPMIVFTADEAWEAIPHLDSSSVHLADWEPFEFSISAEESANWETMFAIRERTLPMLEEARQAKQIGKSLEACVTLTGSGRELEIAQAHGEDLRELINVSELKLETGEGEELQVAVTNAEGEKCERCWRWEPTVGSHDDHATLCTRCVEAVNQATA
ncbi:MAG: class I tRNA ligase family protein, partial [Verrucomicrobiia bacterium]